MLVVDDIEVRDARISDLPCIHKALKKDKVIYSPEKDLEWFKQWWIKETSDGLVGIKKGLLVGYGFLTDITRNICALAHVFISRGLPARSTAIVCAQAVLVWFERYDLQVLYGITPTDNKACVRLMKKLDFQLIYQTPYWTKCCLSRSAAYGNARHTGDAATA